MPPVEPAVLPVAPVGTTVVDEPVAPSGAIVEAADVASVEDPSVESRSVEGLPGLVFSRREGQREQDPRR